MVDEPAILRALAQGVSEQRADLHKDHASRRALGDEFEVVGLVGEMTFALQHGLKIDLTMKPRGDGGMDVMLPLGFTADVKTFRKPYNLIVEHGKVAADVYILARYAEPPAIPSFLGWEWRSAVLAAPTKDFGFGVINHYIAAAKLRPMADLERRILWLKRG